MGARIVSVLLLALIVSGCVITDGFYEPQELKLHLVSADPSQFTVQLSDNSSPPIQVPATGQVILSVPLVRWGQQRVFGVPLNRINSYLPKVQVVSKVGTVTELKIPAIKNAKADESGYHLVKVGNRQIVANNRINTVRFAHSTGQMLRTCPACYAGR